MRPSVSLVAGNVRCHQPFFLGLSSVSTEAFSDGVVSGTSSCRVQTGADGAPGASLTSLGVVSISSGTAPKRSASLTKPVW